MRINPVVLVEVSADYAPRADTAPGSQIALVPAGQGQLGDITDPYMIGRSGRGLAEE